MQLSATWGGVTLAQSGDAINDWKGPQVSVVTQARTATRRATAGRFHRGNSEAKIGFTRMPVPFATPAAAAQFLTDHAIALQGVTAAGDFLYTVGAKNYAMHHAVVTGFSVVRVTGTTVVVAYEITGGALEDVTPP